MASSNTLGRFDEHPPCGGPNRAVPPVVFDVRTVTQTGGGPEKTILFGARWFEDRHWPVYCIYLHPPGDPGFEVIRQKVADLRLSHFLDLDDRGPLDGQLVRRLLAICRQYRPVIWHGHDYKSDALGWLIHRFHPMKLVSTVHGWGVPGRRVWLYHWIHRLCLRGFDRVFCVSAELHTICRRSGIPARICEILENGVDCEAFQPTKDRHEKKQALGIPPDRFVLGYVGRLSPEKNLIVLLEVARELVERNGNVHVLLVGDGPERRALSEYAGRLGIADRVTAVGYASDPRPYYSAMDTFVLLSRSEGLPNVLLEALAMGLPAICTPVGGIPAVIETGRNGMLVLPEDVPGTTAAIQQVMNDPEVARRLGEAGRQTVVSRYSFEQRMNRLCRSYRRLLAQDEKLETRGDWG